MFNFLYTAVSWVLLQWHHLFSAIGLDKDGGANWALSIVFLVITARLLLFRLFIKQVHYQREMQAIQPKIQALREKYKNDRAEMQRQMMQLQQEHGFNPLAGCLPMLVQIPIFLSLFHVLRHLSNSVHRPLTDAKMSLYSFTPHETLSAARAKLFDAPLAASLHDSTQKIHDLFGDPTSTRIVTIVLVVISSAATFLTQRLVVTRQTTVPTGTAATVQRLMMVFIPISVLFSGVIFPLGVLLYWFTSNVWTLGQQAYINKFHPQEAKETATVGAVGKTLAPKPGQRPVRTTKGGNAAPPAASKGTARPVQPAEPTAATGSDGPEGTDAAPPPRNAPRPGQRPTRPAGNRPPAKRPSKAKKRR